MGNIGSLTVLSSDGASDVVKTTTRTVAEAGATVKGLTGLDIPGLINEAVSRQASRSGGAAASGAPPSSAKAGSRTRTQTPARASRAAAPAAAEETEPAERFAQAVEAVEQAGSVRPGSAQAAPPISIPANASADQAATIVADALGRVPGVQRYGEMRLEDLVNRGPRAARTIWSAIPDAVRERIAGETIQGFLERRTKK
jgi:hypothetical protein